MSDLRESDSRYSFDEFRLLYESTEKVTDRRHAANRWNYSICIAIVVAIAGLFNWGLSNQSFLIVSLSATFLLSGMAALFCSLWIAQIRDFKELNNAKFFVLNQMAPKVAFGDTKEDQRISYRVFEREWDTLQNARAVQEIANQNIIALKASNMEYLVPKAFRLLFISTCIALFVFLIMNWAQVVNSSTMIVLSNFDTTMASKVSL